MPKFTIYADEDSLASRPKRWSRSLPLQSTSAHNELETSPAGVKKTRKGKGKAKDYSGGPRNSKRAATAWKDVDALLSHSFTLHRLSPLVSPPFSPFSPASDFARVAKSLQTYLNQQLCLGLDPLDGGTSQGALIKRVEAGFVDLPLFAKQGGGTRPVLVEVERDADDSLGFASTSTAAPSGRISTFVFLPCLSPSSTYYPLLLSKSPSLHLSSLFHRYLTTRHDSLLLPFRIPPSSMLDLLESVVQNRDTSFDEVDAEVDEKDCGLSTTATFAFPKDVAEEGLSTLTVTLPPAILPFLTRPDSTFTSSLTSHLFSLTSLSLSDLLLVRFGAGRGTFVHSGQGAGEGGAKVKFFRGAEEGDEVNRVLEGLVSVAEQTGGA